MTRVGLPANFVAKEKLLSNLEASQKKTVSSTEVTKLKWKTLYIFMIIKVSQVKPQSIISIYIMLQWNLRDLT